MNVLLSVIIPVYNSEKFIENCLLSIKRQSYQNYEVIIIDDGSTDFSSDIIKKYIKNDHRFLYYYQKNSGPSIARNHGLEVSCGKYVVFVDADDYIAEDYLETLLFAIEENNADMCCCGYTNINQNDIYQHNDYDENKINKNQMLINLFKGTGGTICSKIFKKSILNKNNIRFDSEYVFCEDQLFNLKYICNCVNFIAINYYGYYYVREKDSITSTLNYDNWYNQIELLKNIEKILTIYDIPKEIKLIILNNKSFTIIANLLYIEKNNTMKIIYKKLHDVNIKWAYKYLSTNNKIKLFVLLPFKNNLKRMIKRKGNED